MKTLVSLSLLPLIFAIPFTAKAEPISKSQQAEQLNLQAYGFYDRGQYLFAIDTWKKALKLYAKTKKLDKVGEVTIEISQAQKASGQGVAACYTLQRYLKAEPSLCVPANGVQDIALPTIGPTENQAIAAMDFARILRDFGLFEEANWYAEASVESAKDNKLSELIPNLAISKANIDLVKLMFDRDRWSYQEKTYLSGVEADELINRFKRLFSQYEQQIGKSDNLEANLKWLTTYQELQKQSSIFRNSKLQNFPEMLKPQYISKLQSISGFDDFEQFVPSEQLRSRHDIARILNMANQSISSPSLEESSQVWIENLITAAKRLNHQTYLAYGYALLGDRYRYDGRTEKAIRAYQLASSSSQIAHPHYQWQYEIAKLFESLGNEAKAEQFYLSAITSLEEAQFNLSPLEQSIKTNFQESVRPVYNDFIRLQLTKAQPDFDKVFELRNQYTERVVETYLGCGNIETIAPEAIVEQDPDAVIISIFKVNQEYFTVLKNGEEYTYSKYKAELIDKDIDDLLNLFAGRNLKLRTSALNQYFKRLYDRILAPVSNKINLGQTILFANLEPKLQQIPMALLFDGQSYLIEKFPIALVGNILYEPKTLDPQAAVLFAGVSKQSDTNTNFRDIPYVAVEAEKIDPNTVILNERFTESRLSNEISKNHPILHIATHGQFSSQPEDTFLTIWNDKIGLSELSEIVQTRTRTGNPIELLVLSACETAVGDRLATLGIAGISIQSGARSTLASLWQAIDESSPDFMARFYFHLRSGESKAKSVQLAQIEMIEAGYLPYSWATYILMGSWL